MDKMVEIAVDHIRTDLQIPPREETPKWRFSPSDKLGIACALVGVAMGIIVVLIDISTLTRVVLASFVCLLLIYPIIHFIPKGKLRWPAFIALIGLTIFLGWPRKSALEQKIDAIIETLKANKEQEDISLPGWSLHMLINLHDSKTHARETIYDDSTLSVYLSAEKYLTLAYKDVNGEITEIRAPFGQKDGVPKDEIMLLSLQEGLTGKSTILEIAVNGKRVAYETVPGWIKPNPSNLDVKPILGCDQNQSHCAAFELYGVRGYRATLTGPDMYDAAVSMKSHHPGINYQVPQKVEPFR